MISGEDACRAAPTDLYAERQRHSPSLFDAFDLSAGGGGGGGGGGGHAADFHMQFGGSIGWPSTYQLAVMGTTFLLFIVIIYKWKQDARAADLRRQEHASTATIAALQEDVRRLAAGNGAMGTARPSELTRQQPAFGGQGAGVGGMVERIMYFADIAENLIAVVHALGRAIGVRSQSQRRS